MAQWARPAVGPRNSARCLSLKTHQTFLNTASQMLVVITRGISLYEKIHYPKGKSGVLSHPQMLKPLGETQGVSQIQQAHGSSALPIESDTEAHG